MHKDQIEKCIRGDENSCFDLYRKYAPRLFPICIRYARTKEEAEDMLQESFIQIFKRLGEFEYRGSFEGWLSKIAVRTSINVLKSKLGRWGQLLSAEEPQNLPSDSGGFIERETLSQLVAELPDGMRTIFNLSVIEGYSHQEIADLLSISESNSRAQLSRARAKLKDSFINSNLF